MAAIVYLCVVLASVTQSASSKTFSRYSSHSLLFNALKSTSALLFLALISKFKFSFHLPTVIFGCVYGISLCISMHAGYKALFLGPMALTSMLCSFSVILPLIWGVCVGQEEITALKFITFIFLFLAIILTNVGNLKQPSSTQKNYRLWLGFVFITFLCNGGCSILQKQHQLLYPQAYSAEFMLIALLLCSLLFTFLSFRRSSFKELKAEKGKRYGILSGIANAISNFLTLALCGFENASILFPIISAGTLLASLLCGKFIFKEKLKINHYLALGTGVLAIVFLKL